MVNGPNLYSTIHLGIAKRFTGNKSAFNLLHTGGKFCKVPPAHQERERFTQLREQVGILYLAQGHT